MLRIDAFRLVAAAITYTVALSPAIAQPDAAPEDRPLRLGIVGLVHGHVYSFLDGACKRPDVDVVGIAEPRPDLLKRYATFNKLPDDVLFRDLPDMLDETKPEAVAVFTDIRDHLAVVEACAKRGVHVMVEKPLAVSAEHAHKIKQLAEKHGIHVITNYETTWYPNTFTALKLLTGKKALGPLLKIIAKTGHQGPKEINMPQEFLDFLLDPERNGAGALYDFGCYGVNLAVCLMGNQPPETVTAVTQQYKTDPEYKNVDDEATIILTWPKTQAIIQASWNWPYNRKDMEIYGERGTYVTVGRDAYRLPQSSGEKIIPAERPPAAEADPISYLKAVAHGSIEPDGPSSLEVNVIVSEILDAARESARTGRTVRLKSPKP